MPECLLHGEVHDTCVLTSIAGLVNGIGKHVDSININGTSTRLLGKLIVTQAPGLRVAQVVIREAFSNFWRHTQ